MIIFHGGLPRLKVKTVNSIIVADVTFFPLQKGRNAKGRHAVRPEADIPQSTFTVLVD